MPQEKVSGAVAGTGSKMLSVSELKAGWESAEQRGQDTHGICQGGWELFILQVRTVTHSKLPAVCRVSAP